MVKEKVPSPSKVRKVFRKNTIERLSVNPGGRMALAIKSLSSQGLAGTGLMNGQGYNLGGNPYSQDTEELEDVYRQEPWIAAGINLLARVCSDVKRTVWDRSADDPNAIEVIDPKDPIYKFLNSGARVSGETISGTLASKHDAINLSLTGESVWLLHDEFGNPVPALTEDSDSLIDVPVYYTPVRGDLCTIKRDRNGKTLEWRVATSRGKGYVKYPPGSVLVFMELPDHSRPNRGLGLIQQSWGPAAQSHLARRYNSTWLRNYGDPGGVLSYDGWLSDDQYERVQQEKAGTFDNPDNVGQTQVVEGGMKYEQSKAKPRDMAFETLLEAGRIEMSALMGTSEGVLGGKDMTYATFVGHFRTFMFLRVEPYLNAMADTINTELLPRLRDIRLSQYRVSYDTSSIRRKIDNATEQASQVSALIEAGVTPNEALMRSEMDADPIEIDGDLSYTKRSMIPRSALVLTEGANAIKAMRDAGIEDGDVVSMMPRLGMPNVTSLREREVPAPVMPTEVAAGARSAPVVGKATEAKRDLQPTENASVEQAKATKASSPSRNSMTRQWNKREERIKVPRRKLLRSISRVMNKARAQQLEALTQFAATGKKPNKDAHPAIVPVDLLTGAHIRSFEDAWRRDERAQGIVDREVPELSVQSWFGCDGEWHHAKVESRQCQEDWMTRHKQFERYGLERLRGAVLCARANVSEEEIDRLLVLGKGKFEAELADSIEKYSFSAYSSASKVTADSLGMTIVGATDPAVLNAFAKRAIRVAEGTTSPLAKSLRRNILGALVDNPTMGSVQDRVAAALKEVKASTTKAFASHRHRAQTIAYTEVSSADNAASYETGKRAYKEGRITGFGWVTSGRGPAPTGTVRPTHYGLETSGQEVIPGKTFSNGLRYPLDKSSNDAGEIVNCQCTLRFALRAEGKLKDIP